MSKGVIVAFLVGVLLATFVTAVPAMVKKVVPV